MNGGAGPEHDDDPGQGDGGAALLMRTWNDGEAEIVRRLLASYGIPSQVVSDVPHAVLPVSVDGLGEIRILVPADRLEEARTILVEHRRSGMDLVREDEDAAREEPE